MHIYLRRSHDTSLMLVGQDDLARTWRRGSGGLGSYVGPIAATAATALLAERIAFPRRAIIRRLRLLSFCVGFPERCQGGEVGAHGGGRDLNLGPEGRLADIPRQGDGAGRPARGETSHFEHDAEAHAGGDGAEGAEGEDQKEDH